LRHSLAPDNKGLSILFDNFLIRFPAGDQQIVTRTLSVAFPITGVKEEATLVMGVRGFVALGDGLSCSLIVRVLGETHVLDPLLGEGEKNPGNYTKDLSIKVPPGADLRMTFVIVLERDAANPAAEGQLVVDSVDLAFAAAAAK
jgi:hypothetical protein